jgi:integrase
MADSGVYDRWHKAKPNPDESRCREHKRVPSASHGQGKRWQARWRDESGAQRKQSHDRERDAERALAVVKVDLPRGAYVDPRAGRVTFRTHAEQWRAAQVHRATTVAQVETHLRRHIYPTFGDRALGSIRPSEVQAWVRRLEQDLAPSTIGVVYSFVAGIFRAAVRDRLIVASPCVDVRLPKPEPKRVEPLATERVEALIAAVPERHRALVVLAAGTGLRQGECLGVELETIDFLRRTLWVRQQLVTMPGKPPYLAPPKTRRPIGRCRSRGSSSTRWPSTWPCSRRSGWRSPTRRSSRNRSHGWPRWCSPTRRAGRCAGPGSRTCGGRRWRQPASATG